MAAERNMSEAARNLEQEEKMAKRAGSSEFNMAAEIRNLLTQNREMSGREVVDALKVKYPKHTFNENSCSVAFANARAKLGIKKVKRRRPVGKVGRKQKEENRPWAAVGRVAAAEAAATSVSPQTGLELLSAAKNLLQVCRGDAALAAAAIKQLASLQIS